jgi:DNA mismatch repair protein MutL
MAKVNRLDPHLVNKIAAGEVIERPASVVKELVENSLDAGALRVEMAIEHGGLSRITVADDGEGMSPKDLELAIQRHTTSKISTEEDLEQISTLGFRGEALASIVEISKTTITTRARGSEEALQLAVEGGEVRSLEPAARARGTTVEVKEIFYNTPARRKYLRSERTERFQIARTMRRFILAHSKVHFKLTNDNRLSIEAPPAADLRERVAAIFGPELARSLIEVQSEGKVRVSGLIGRPEGARADRQDQFIFVNGRYVRDRAVSYALSRAYEGLVKGGKFPPVFLFIEIMPELVDVNVHPRKEEVRFADPRLVQGEVKRALGAALLSHEIVPQLEPEQPRREPHYHGYRRVPQEEGLELSLKREFAELREAPQAVAPPKREVAGLRLLGQLHNTYILLQTDEGLELIDQHVAHERILYEKFLAQLQGEEVPRQRLLIPLTLEFPQDEAELLAERLDFLDRRLGIGLEAFGGGSFILRDWPQILAERLTKEGAREAIEKILKILESGEEPNFAELVHQLAAGLACAAAVKKNTSLAPEEMQNLVQQLRQAENPYRCPHGRPIIVKYTLEDLEKRFGRR